MHVIDTVLEIMNGNQTIPQKVFHVLGKGHGEGRYLRQSASLNDVGVVLLTIEPSEVDGLTFEWSVKEEEIPTMFRAAVLQGIDELLKDTHYYIKREWASGGCAFTHTKVKIIGGSYHETDSRETSYQVAGAFAFVEAIEMAGFSLEMRS